MACMNRNDFDRTACQDAFQAYRDCKKAWVRILALYLAFRRAGLISVQMDKLREDRRNGRV
jgi:hypothetical protein